MTITEKTTPHLPAELWDTIILPHLDPFDLLEIKGVNREWYRTAHRIAHLLKTPGMLNMSWFVLMEAVKNHPAYEVLGPYMTSILGTRILRLQKFGAYAFRTYQSDKIFQVGHRQPIVYDDEGHLSFRIQEKRRPAYKLEISLSKATKDYFFAFKHLPILAPSLEELDPTKLPMQQFKDMFYEIFTRQNDTWELIPEPAG